MSESSQSNLNPNDQLLERARNVIRELREKLVAAEALSKPAPIAIIGMACDFPGVRTDLDAFWKMTVEGRDAVSMIPEDRWDREALYAPHAPTPGKMNTREAAFLGDVARFDAAFFDVAPVEAVRMDPQQRIFLETAWHAIEDAGLSREMLSGSETGVFVGVHSQSMDYYALQASEIDSLDAYAATGTAQDVIAGRLAYWLNLQGPSMAVNTACSSSLVALHLACRSLRAGDCSAAIAGGVNLLLSPTTSVAASQLQMLAPDGRCKAFDSHADGFGRGEGCGIVILKRLADAERDGDRILTIIRGSAINQDGKTNGLTAPNGLAQQRLLRRALENAGIAPSQVGYVEAHGTGTTLGDPIEVEALTEVLGAENRIFPCALGSVKANIGHLEGAAGIAGVIKAVLVLRNGYIPPVANLKQLNPHLALRGSGLHIPMQGQPWPRNGQRIAGVSSFGWSGTNAHFVLEEAAEPQADNSAFVAESSFVVAVSAQSTEALYALMLAYADRIENVGQRELRDIGFTSTLRRSHHAHRVAVTGTNGSEIAAILRAKATALKAHEGVRHSSENAIQSSSDSANRLQLIIRMYEQGSDVEWKEIYPSGGRTVSLPRYPFQGKRYWLSERSIWHSSTANTTAPDAWFYSTEWVERPLPISSTPTPFKAWLIFDDGSAFGETLANVVRKYGHRGILVSSGENLSRLSTNHYTIPGANPDQLDQLFALLVSEGISTANVIFIAGQSRVEELTSHALHLAQAILRSKLDLKLWFISRQSQEDHAALLGFTRVFGLEHPDRSGVVINIDEHAVEEQAIAVFNEIAHVNSEDKVALRAGRRFVPRLKRRTAVRNKSFTLREDRCYLITGAFGGIGRHLAEWLVKRGARNLVLVGRRHPDEMQQTELIRRLDDLRKQGVTIHLQVCDIADASAVDSLFRDIELRAKPLYGVIHAAAAISFGSIAQATQRDIDLAFGAKVEGARLLDLHTRKHPLDFFLLFSSAAVSIGSRNAALYAAANSCLNSLAIDRRHHGLAASSIEWGLWADSAAIGQRSLITNSGFLPMQPAKALDALERILLTEDQTDDSTTLIADIDWQTLRPALHMQHRGLFIADLDEAPRSTVVAGEALASTHTPKILLKIQGAPATERLELLIEYVSAETKSVFGIAADEPLDEGRGFFDLGMDSLMSVELKKQLELGLGVQLPDTLTLTYPSITALATYLKTKLFSEANDAELEIAEMDDAETDAAIAAELAAIHQKLGAR
ncbi:type I polyketide synthase [Acidicapsa ligni]|uniref:type I polyketide synthase n=1 Tax=Acidicapsa ligni TaxID=542300 RepID=UPI0021DFB80F|nr:SDR family NAD(P)-dependent oxidoreductase [Acidicapsa ligni]